MRRTPRAAALGATAAAAAVAAAVFIGFTVGNQLGSIEARPQTPVAPATAITSFPGPSAAGADVPRLASLDGGAPEAGTVGQASGPFDDRFVLRNLAFDGSEVSGTVLVTSDVSALIELEVVAGFYDASGALLGEGDFVLHEGEYAHVHDGVPGGGEAFEVDVPEVLLGRAVSAAVGIPVLVNE
jgi:hypothetical protein